MNKKDSDKASVLAGEPLGLEELYSKLVCQSQESILVINITSHYSIMDAINNSNYVPLVRVGFFLVPYYNHVY